MKVTIKNFNVGMEVKTAGIEFQVKENGGKHLGDLVLTKSKLIWCQGKTTPAKGKSITWGKFIEYMESL